MRRQDFTTTMVVGIGTWPTGSHRTNGGFQRAHAEFMTLAVHFPPGPPGLSEEHSRLKGMVDLRVTRLRALARRIQESGWLE